MKTITNIIITHAVFLLLFGGATLALALEETPSLDEAQQQAKERREEFLANTQERQQQRDETVAEFQTNAEGLRAEFQAKQAERRSQLEERAQERITNLAANVSNSMETAITRLQNIIDRLHSRIEKLEALGVDTAKAKTALDSAQLSIDAAITELSDIDEQVAEVVGSEDVKTAWAETRAIYSSVHGHLKTARAELQATVAALKEAAAAAELGRGASAAVRNNPETEEAVDAPEEN
jgi:Skp family chaperone for outer membrane proteins